MRSGLDAVVWVADDEVFAGLDYGCRLAERLRARGLRVGCEDLTAARSDRPAARLHVMSGGGTSVRDRSGWMRSGLKLTRELIAGARRGEHAVFGVCLGSQMIAETLWPGSVQRGERIEAGLTEVEWRPGGSAERERLVVPAFHYEQVDRARAVRGGARVVAQNARSLQGFRFGSRLWGVQFHPELAPADVRRLLAHHRRTIEAHRHTVEAAGRSVDELEAAWDPGVFDRILAQVTADGR